MLFVLTSCGRGSAPLCVLADDFGDLNKGEFELSATNSGWVDTGIDTLSLVPLQIHTQGIISVCSGLDLIEEVIYSPDSNLRRWEQVPGLRFFPGELYSVSVTGTFSRYADRSNPISNGDDLYIYFGTPPSDGDSSGSNDTFYDGSAGVDPQVRELNLTIPRQNIPAAGNVYLRFDDDERVSGWGPDYHYGDNTSDYEVTIRRYGQEGCVGTNGEFLMAYIGDTPPTDAELISYIDNNRLDAENIINLHEYHDVDPSNPGLFNDQSFLQPGSLWLRIIDDATIDWEGTGVARGDHNYAQILKDPTTGNYISGSNDGSYTVNITTRAEISSGVGNFINSVIDPTREAIFGTDGRGGIIETIFNGLTGNGRYIAALQAVLTMSVIFYALTYVIGVNPVPQKDLIMYILKISFVIALIDPDSWEFFYNNLFGFFVEEMDDLGYIMSSQFLDVVTGFVETVQDGSGVAAGETQAILRSTDASRDAFGFLNKTLGRFFSEQVNFKILGLIGLPPLGPFYMALIYWAMIMFIFGVAQAVFVYLASIILLGVLLFLAPVFIPFLLFAKTKSIFDNWLKALLSVAIQPVILIALIAIFNVFIYSMFYVLLHYSVCWGCVFEIDFMITELLDSIGISALDGGVEFDQLCILHSYKPWGSDGGQDVTHRLAGTPVGLFGIIALLTFIITFTKFAEWVVEVSTAIIGSPINLRGTATAAMVATKDAVVATGQLGVGTAKTGLKVAGGVLSAADSMGGSVASDGLKKATRKLLPKGMTRKKDGNYKDGLQTSSEKKAARQELKDAKKRERSRKLKKAGGTLAKMVGRGKVDEQANASQEEGANAGEESTQDVSGGASADSANSGVSRPGVSDAMTSAAQKAQGKDGASSSKDDGETRDAETTGNAEQNGNDSTVSRPDINVDHASEDTAGDKDPNANAGDADASQASGEEGNDEQGSDDSGKDDANSPLPADEQERRDKALIHDDKQEKKEKDANKNKAKGRLASALTQTSEQQQREDKKRAKQAGQDDGIEENPHEDDEQRKEKVKRNLAKTAPPKKEEKKDEKKNDETDKPQGSDADKSNEDDKKDDTAARAGITEAEPLDEDKRQKDMEQGEEELEAIKQQEKAAEATGDTPVMTDEGANEANDEGDDPIELDDIGLGFMDDDDGGDDDSGNKDGDDEGS